MVLVTVSLVLELPRVFVRDLMRADLSATAGLHTLAFPQAAISLLGHETTRRYHDFLKNGSVDLVGLGAFEGEKLAGFCFGGSVRDVEGAFLRRNLGFVTGRIGARPWLLLRATFRNRIARGFRFLFSVAPKQADRSVRIADEAAVRSFGVLYLAVAPSYQGRGIAKLLLAESENVASTRGYTCMDLAVYPDNHAAIGLYEQMGWQRLTEGGSWRGLMFKSIA